MNPAVVVKIITAALSTVATLLVKAFTEGDHEAWKRVRDIIPSPMKSEAKLEYEEARHRRLQAEQERS